MPINDRNLKPGVKLVGRYHKQTYTCEVVEVDGKLKFRLADGREFKSPSAAGMAITGKSCNGWAFWSVQKEEAPVGQEQATNTPPETPAAPATEAQTPAGEPEAPAPAATEPAAEPPARPSPIYKLPNQKGAPEGQARWYCRECKQGFLAPVGTTPESCPQGHRAG